MHLLLLAHHIHTELKRHLTDYLLLFTSGILFLMGVQIVRAEKTKLFSLLIVFTGFYIVWGLYHHARKQSLHLKTVIEYILIGFSVLFLLRIIFLPYL